MSNSEIEQLGTVKGHLPNEASLSGRISNGLSLSGHISIGGAGDFVIKMTVEGNDGGGYTVTSCDATIEQIDAAIADEKRVVVVASVGNLFFLELPMIRGVKGNFYYFGIFLSGSMILSLVYKVDGNTSKWEFEATQIGAESVGYSNEALPNTSTVEGALDVLVSESHTHANKETLDKFAESNGKPTYSGKEIVGAGDFIIKMTVESDDDGNLTVTSCDATIEQIDAAVADEKRVVVVTSFDGAIFEMPMVQYIQGIFYYFGMYMPLSLSVMAATVAKDPESGADDWEFYFEPFKADAVEYYNAALPNIYTVEGALDELVSKSHTHSNKDTLDKLSDSNGKLQYNGSDVGLKGDKGATPDIQIGTVQTLPAESPATASMTGTPESPLLNLGIPQGKDGGGINVTGATVGQTVRIAAVDENGAPTAWEAVDLTVGDKWELLGTLEASTADVLQLEFPSQMRQIMFYLKIIDSAGDQYGPSATAYRTVSLLTGKWELLHDVKIGMCSHNWGINCKGHLMCEQEFSWVEIAKPSLSATTSLLCVAPARRVTNNSYFYGNVSGIRFTTVLPDDVENTASGTIKIWGVRA